MSKNIQRIYYTPKEQPGLEGLMPHELQQFCFKHVRLDMTRKNLFEEETTRLSNCLVKTLKSMNVLVSAWAAMNADSPDDSNLIEA